tara:strand:+ start:14339 stop:14950 length:612 start_codon:yes stop_codon:yes gene_type:complete
MSAQHLALLVEEPSMEAFLRELLPRLLPHDRSFEIHAFQGKADLLRKLEGRLRGYSHFLPPEWRVVVVVDRDDDDCRALKSRLDSIANTSGLRTDRSRLDWQLVNRIAIEELEAWYFGDWEAVRASYPRVSVSIPERQGFRDPDAIAGGTWESFERVLMRHGYYKAGLAKVEAARNIGRSIDPWRSRSKSFAMFCAAIRSAAA